VKRRIATITAVGAALVALLAGTTAAAPVQVLGTVGPGETIGLRSAGKKVTRLKAGPHRFVIRDRSDEHDFRVVGPGTSKVLTGVEFTGTKSVLLKLKKGSYRFFCAPHADDMHGSFAVR
jgi:plastocyanin